MAWRIGVSLRSLQRWRQQLQQTGASLDGRKSAERQVAHKLTAEERQALLDTVNDPKYSHLPPAQIVADLAENGRYIASESSFYRVMRDEQLIQHRGRSKPPREPRSVPRLETRGPNVAWSWDITLLPSGVKGIWFYLYMVMDVWSRKIIAWEIHERECPLVAGEMLQRACWREGISKVTPVILHSDNGNPMRALTLAAKLDELGVGRSYSRPRVSNDNPFSESLFHTLKYHPRYPVRGFADEEAARQWILAFVTWYNSEHRHSGIKYVTPDQRHHGKADAICRQRTRTYEKAYVLHPARWSRHIRCWKQPEAVWINQPRPIHQAA